MHIDAAISSALTSPGLLLYKHMIDASNTANTQYH